MYASDSYPLMTSRFRIADIILLLNSEKFSELLLEQYHEFDELTECL